MSALHAAKVTLLGPQRREPTLGAVVESLGLRGRLATITAGWEEREDEDRELSEHLGGRALNLEVHARGEEVYARDPELFGAMRARHDLLRRAQELYRLRLEHGMEAARELLRRCQAETQPAHLALVRQEADEAIAAVRALDAEHQRRIERVHLEFESRWRPREREHVRRHREALARELEGCEAVCVAGGHVTVLLNRMRLLGLHELWGARPLIAWSAGARVRAERVVLVHDSPPQGPGNAELLEVGLRAHRGLVPLPHADKRLRLEDRTRVSLFARRFGPQVCAVLVQGARLDWDGARWRGAPGTRRLCEDGNLADCGEQVAVA